MRIGRPCCSCRTAGRKNGEGAEGVAEGQRAFRVAEAEGDGAAVGHVAEVGAGGKNRVAAGQHDAAHVLILAQRGEVFGQPATSSW